MAENLDPALTGSPAQAWGSPVPTDLLPDPGHRALDIVEDADISIMEPLMPQVTTPTWTRCLSSCRGPPSGTGDSHMTLRPDKHFQRGPLRTTDHSGSGDQPTQKGFSGKEL